MIFVFPRNSIDCSQWLPFRQTPWVNFPLVVRCIKCITGLSPVFSSNCAKTLTRCRGRPAPSQLTEFSHGIAVATMWLFGYPRPPSGLPLIPMVRFARLPASTSLPLPLKSSVRHSRVAAEPRSSSTPRPVPRSLLTRSFRWPVAVLIVKPA